MDWPIAPPAWLIPLLPALCRPPPPPKADVQAIQAVPDGTGSCRLITRGLRVVGDDLELPGPFSSPAALHGWLGDPGTAVSLQRTPVDGDTLPFILATKGRVSLPSSAQMDPQASFEGAEDGWWVFPPADGAGGNLVVNYTQVRESEEVYVYSLTASLSLGREPALDVAFACTPPEGQEEEDPRP